MSSNFDLFSRRFKADPFPTFGALRREAPVYRHVAPDGTVIWYITRYDDVARVLRDDENFVKDVRNATRSEPPGSPQSASSLHRLLNENMLFSDPPDHTRLRALVGKAFTPHRVEAMRPRVKAIAGALLDQVVEKGSMDLVAEYALPLPVAVISDLLGLPSADREQVLDWSQAIISPGSRNLNYSQRKRKIRALVDYLGELFDRRRREPLDDMVSALVEAGQDGDRLSEEELSSMVALLLVTGHETTVNLIGNGALALLGDPAQRELFCDRPELQVSAVEELLRYDGPVETSTTRWARRDLRFNGHLIRRGDVVRVVLASANRDAAHFREPEQLDITRKENRHLAFGLGIHYCLGAPLARLEGQIALASLFERLPNLQLAAPAERLTWRSGILFRGLKALPVRWEASKASAPVVDRRPPGGMEGQRHAENAS